MENYLLKRIGFTSEDNYVILYSLSKENFTNSNKNIKSSVLISIIQEKPKNRSKKVKEVKLSITKEQAENLLKIHEENELVKEINSIITQ
ncbi:hypothetical protein ACTNDN_22795 [Niallia sp. HCP3S3_B10]|uniref:hypothetical protein n=1 Tax=Niallia sp. HCP3S3_B10 TaxID=3438944 RepID=UPI003F8BDB1F